MVGGVSVLSPRWARCMRAISRWCARPRRKRMSWQFRSSSIQVNLARTRISANIRACLSAFGRGEQDPETLISAAKQVILQESAVRLDYLEIVDPDSLEPISQTAWGQPPSAVRPSAARPSRSALVAIAAFVGTTRLIDNVVLN